MCERVLRVSVRQCLELSELHERNGAPSACPWSWAGVARQRLKASSAGMVHRPGIAGGDARGMRRDTFQRFEGPPIPLVIQAT